jgi:hypothetical protein
MDEIITLKNWILKQKNKPLISIRDFRQREHARRAWEFQKRRYYTDQIEHAIQSRATALTKESDNG